MRHRRPDRDPVAANRLLRNKVRKLELANNKLGTQIAQALKRIDQLESKADEQ